MATSQELYHLGMRIPLQAPAQGQRHLQAQCQGQGYRYRLPFRPVLPLRPAAALVLEHHSKAKEAAVPAHRFLLPSLHLRLHQTPNRPPIPPAPVSQSAPPALPAPLLLLSLLLTPRLAGTQEP